MSWDQWEGQRLDYQSTINYTSEPRLGDNTKATSVQIVGRRQQREEGVMNYQREKLKWNNCLGSIRGSISSILEDRAAMYVVVWTRHKVA
jgi:hypothetical protein